MHSDYVSPAFEKDAFNCPSCGVYARQTFHGAMRTVSTGQFAGALAELKHFEISTCDRCEHVAIWHNEVLVYPTIAAGPLPHPDMPEEVAADYSEARQIASRSPRSAAALLRLALQKLCIHLGGAGENLNSDIGELVQKGLDAQVQRALDTLRIVGNNAVHPGEIDLRDDQATVERLFRLLNFVVQQMITQPKEIAELWGTLPEGPRRAAEERGEKKDRRATDV